MQKYNSVCRLVGIVYVNPIFYLKEYFVHIVGYWQDDGNVKLFHRALVTERFVSLTKLYKMEDKQ